MTHHQQAAAPLLPLSVRCPCCAHTLELQLAAVDVRVVEPPSPPDDSNGQVAHVSLPGPLPALRKPAMIKERPSSKNHAPSLKSHRTEDCASAPAVKPRQHQPVAAPAAPARDEMQALRDQLAVLTANSFATPTSISVPLSTDSAYTSGSTAATVAPSSVSSWLHRTLHISTTPEVAAVDVLSHAGGRC
jgi:hypothetical protein